MSRKMKKKVSVVIVTKNEESNISECIKSVFWADEIIVVLGHQKDLLLPMLQQYKSVTPIYNQNYLSGKTTSIKC